MQRGRGESRKEEGEVQSCTLGDVSVSYRWSKVSPSRPS